MASFNLKRFIRQPGKGLRNAGRSLGKAAKQAAPVVGLIPGVGTAAGAAIGGLGSVLSGGNMKSHLNAGIQGGLSGYANTKLLGGQGYKGILSMVPGMGAGTSAMPTTAAAGNTAVSTIPAASGAPGTLMAQYGGTGAGGLLPSAGGGIGVGASQIGGTLGTALPEVSGSALASAAPKGLLGKAASVGGRVLGFAERHPNAVAGALSAAGGLMGGGAERDLMEAQTARLEQDNAESVYDFEARKLREQELAKIFGELGIETPGFRGVAANPYVS